MKAKTKMSNNIVNVEATGRCGGECKMQANVSSHLTKAKCKMHQYLSGCIQRGKLHLSDCSESSHLTKAKCRMCECKM